jgi:pyrroline-5-carboxylate reductase
MSIHLPALAIIGTGKMGGAILDGVSSPGVTPESLRVTTQSEHSAALLRNRGFAVASVEGEDNANEWAVAGAKVVIVAVKPAYLVEVVRSFAHALADDAVIVSVAAGITTEALEAISHHAVIRAMPNTPTQIGQGVTGLSVGSRANTDQANVVHTIFQQLGHVVTIPEERMNALSAISGSGPAYLFYLAEKMTDVAMSHGFSAEQANTMVRGTLLGAAALLDQSGDSPAALRAAVTSPGGTTEQAIGVFDEANLGQVVADAVNRAIAKAQEIGRQ